MACCIFLSFPQLNSNARTWPDHDEATSRLLAGLNFSELMPSLGGDGTSASLLGLRQDSNRQVRQGIAIGLPAISRTAQNSAREQPNQPPALTCSSPPRQSRPQMPPSRLRPRLPAAAVTASLKGAHLRSRRFPARMHQPAAQAVASGAACRRLPRLPAGAWRPASGTVQAAKQSCDTIRGPWRAQGRARSHLGALRLASRRQAPACTPVYPPG